MSADEQAVDLLAEAIGRAYAALEFSGEKDIAKELADAFDASRSAPSPAATVAEGEPVAWQYLRLTGEPDRIVTFAEPADEYRHRYRPLYAPSGPADARVRKLRDAFMAGWRFADETSRSPESAWADYEAALLSEVKP